MCRPCRSVPGLKIKWRSRKAASFSLVYFHIQVFRKVFHAERISGKTSNNFRSSFKSPDGLLNPIPSFAADLMSGGLRTFYFEIGEFAGIRITSDRRWKIKSLFMDSNCQSSITLYVSAYWALRRE